MTLEIKLSTDQMRLMSLFQSITKATARDCIEDEKQNRIIFIVNEGKMGAAIGKGGSHIKQLQNKIDRNVELVEYSNDPTQLLKNILNEKYIKEIKMSERLDGSQQAIVIVDNSKKGAVVGREGRNAEKARILARRYFNITSVLINSEELSLEW
jgi:N utilization substance protein A